MPTRALCPLLAALIGSAVLSHDAEEEDWIHFALVLGASSRVELDITHQGFGGRSIGWSVTRAEGRPEEGGLVLPAGATRAKLALPAGEGALRVSVIERRSKRLLLDAELVEQSLDWLWCGPFPCRGNGAGQAFEPERGKLDLGERFDTESGELGWRAFDPTWFAKDAFVNLDGLCGGRDHVVAYVATLLSFETPTKGLLELGSDDSLQVFQNGREVHRFAGDRGSAPGQDSVPVAFKRGSNALLIKVGDQGGAFGFHLRLRDAGGAPLAGYTHEGFRHWSWRPPEAPRVLWLEGDRAALEFDSPEPRLAAVEIRRARDDAPDPQGFLKRGTAIVLSNDQTERRIDGDGVLRTRQRIEVAGLEVGRRLALAGRLRDPRGASGGVERPEQETAWRVVKLEAPGRTWTLHAKFAVLFAADVATSEFASLERPTSSIEAAIAAARAELEASALWLFQQSEGRLAVELEFFLDWDKRQVAPQFEAGLMRPEDEWQAFEKSLGQAQKQLAQYDGLVLVTCERAIEAASRRWIFRPGPSRTRAAAAPRGQSLSLLELGGEPDLAFAGECADVVEGWLVRSGAPSPLELGPATPASLDPRQAIAERLRRSVATEPFEGTAPRTGPRGWRLGASVFGRVRDWPDADGDGLADSASDLPFDEQRFGSSSTSADTDGDGWSDLEEFLRGDELLAGNGERSWSSAPRRLSPARADSDGDGRPDPGDAAPTWPTPLDLGERLAVLAEHAELGRVEFGALWRDGALHLDLSSSQALERARVELDFDADSTQPASCDLALELAPERGLAACRRSSSDAGGARVETEAVLPSEVLQVDVSSGQNWTVSLRPHPSAGFDGLRGEPLALRILVRPPIRSGATTAPDAWLALLGPHIFLRTRLPE